MAKGKARSGFDLDLRDGQFAEGKLAKLLKESGPLIEVKSEKDSCPKYGNLFVEARQPDPVLGGVKESGIAVTESQHWAEEIAQDSWLIVPTERLKAILRIVYKRNRKRGSAGFTKGGDNDKYLGIKISIRELIEAILGRKI